MKRKSIDELFDDLHISSNSKKLKTVEENSVKDKNTYTQDEVDNLLRTQQDYFFKEFRKYVEDIRSTSPLQIPHWTI